MTDLSPAAQAVYDAFWEGIRYNDDITDSNIAAALRAAAQTLAYEAYGEGWFELVVDASDIYTIADELEKQAYEL